MNKVASIDPLRRGVDQTIAGAIVAGQRGVVDRDAEEMLVAAIAMCDVRLEWVRDILPDHTAFSTPDMRDWYEAMCALADEGTDIDVGRLCRWLGAKHGGPKAAEVIGTYNRQMTATYANVRSLTQVTAIDRAAAIRECWMKREMAAMAIELQARAYSYESTLSELQDLVTAKLEGLTARQLTTGTIGGKELAIEAAKAMKAPAQGIPLGMPRLTRVLGGLKAQETTIIAARTSVGKSMLAMQACLWAAKQGHGVSYASLEMSPAKLAVRAVAHLGQLNGKYAQGEELDRGEYLRLAPAINELHHLPLLVHPSQSANIATIARVARKHAAEFRSKGKKLGILVIDHVGLVKPPKELAGASKNQQVSHTSGMLRDLAEKLDCHVIGLAQINREAEKGSGDGSPRVAMLKDSGSLEEDADNVVLVHRPKLPDGTFDRDKNGHIFVGKNRYGDLAMIPVECNDRYQTFTEVQP